MITYFCLGPSIISLLMRLRVAFLASALLLINWELSYNAGSVWHKLTKVSLSLSLNFMSDIGLCVLFTIYDSPSSVVAYRLKPGYY